MIDGETNIAFGSAELYSERAEPNDPPDTRSGPAGTARQPESRREPSETQPGRDERAELLASHEAQELRSRWDQIQTGFVDEPRRSVKDADALVAETINRLSETFTQARGRMEQEWDGGDSVSTEDLRMALRRYRSFFTRLLAM